MHHFQISNIPHGTYLKTYGVQTDTKRHTQEDKIPFWNIAQDKEDKNSHKMVTEPTTTTHTFL